MFEYASVQKRGTLVLKHFNIMLQIWTIFPHLPLTLASCFRTYVLLFRAQAPEPLAYPWGIHFCLMQSSGEVRLQCERQWLLLIHRLLPKDWWKMWDFSFFTHKESPRHGGREQTKPGSAGGKFLMVIKQRSGDRWIVAGEFCAKTTREKNKGGIPERPLCQRSGISNGTPRIQTSILSTQNDFTPGISMMPERGGWEEIFQVLTNVLNLRLWFLFHIATFKKVRIVASYVHFWDANATQNIWCISI